MQILQFGMWVLFLTILQNASFSLVSRSRNRDNMTYHIVASAFSNTLWFLTMRELILSDMELTVLPFYMVGAIIGSVFGAKISMRIEKLIGASADGHLKKKD